jgi:hypothetical protein
MGGAHSIEQMQDHRRMVDCTAYAIDLIFDAGFFTIITIVLLHFGRYQGQSKGLGLAQRAYQAHYSSRIRQKVPTGWPLLA